MSSTTRQDAEAIDRWMKSLLGSTKETAVVVLSPDGTILAWLGAAAILFGYDAGEAVGMPMRRLFTEEDVAGRLDLQERELALASGRSEDDRWHVRKDGSRFWGSGVMEPIRGDRGEVVALAKVLRDRTDVRTQVVALQNRLLAAEEQNANRLAVLASLAHELRNQVTPLANLLSAFELAHGGDPAAGAMRRQVRNMTRLVDDLAGEAGGAAAPPALKPAPMDVQSCVLHAANGIAGSMAARGQTLKVTLPEAPITIEADGQRVDQMLANLLSNASKYTPAGGTVQLSATVEDDMAAIRVEDDGQGISADLLPKIFELFTRDDRPNAPEGLGVGLAVVKKLAELHGGFVEGRSPGPGKGSIFTIRLPLVQPRTASQFGQPAGAAGR
jgi:PAS domain S-box-containing protein